jgi:arylsulfatase A-like enzyme
MNRREFLLSTSAGLLTAQTQKPPNLLYIIADQFRFDAMSCAGNKVLPTPHLDRIAREGVRFADANCAYPVCVPSRTAMLTGRSVANTHVHGNDAAQDLVSDPGPSFDNIRHDRGYKSQYYGKWHAPYKMARTYDNKVAAVNVRGLPNEHTEFLAWLDEHVPKREPRKGELLDKAYNRPYRPYPVDTQYEDAQAGKPVKDTHPTQQETIGVVDVPAQFSMAAHPVERSLKALDEMKDGPFSLTCSIGPPHPPFLAVEPFAGRFHAEQMPVPPNVSYDNYWAPYRLRSETDIMRHYHNAAYVRQLTAAYYAMVAHVDDQIGRLLKRLDELKLTANTMIVFTADHGEMLGAQGLVSKMVFHEEAVHVPLLMRLPGAIRAGTVVEAPVSGMDIFATVLEYLGAKPPVRDGDSLRPLIEARKGSGAGPDYRVAEWAQRNVPNFMVRTREWKLMIADSPDSHAVDALFDMREDPYEMHNLLGDPADRAKYAGRADEMKQRLLAWLDRVGSPQTGGVKARKLG